LETSFRETMQTHESILAELAALKAQLQEANETIEAIRTGQVDAIVVQNGDGHQLYTLKSADHTYRVFIEKMKEGAVTLNKDGTILYSNSQFASMVGTPLTHVIGVNFIEFIPPDSRKYFTGLMEKGWHSDSKGEIFLQNTEKTLVPFLLSFTSLQLDEGQALSIILTDLSAQKETEKELTRKNRQLEEARHAATEMNERLEDLVKERTNELFLSRENFKFLADHIPVMVWTARADGTVTYFNQKWYEYTGLTEEESFKSGGKVAIHPDDLSLAIRTWEDARESNTKFELEYRVKNGADGEYRWHLNKGEPFRDESGQIIAWFGTLTGIEDQRKQLDRKDEFISVASHELKTPLTSLKGYIQLMTLQQDIPEEFKLYLHRANDSVNKLQRLINDLLDVSKIHAGKLKFDMQPLNLAEIVQACAENSEHMYPTHTFHKDIAPSIPITGNGERIEQVIMNLVSNAVKYSPDNKDIALTTCIAGDWATVTVTDKGIGLSTEDQQKIFDRFYRVDNSSLFASGLGMGLYIAAEIVKEHNGKMDVKSKLGKGSSISFLLPVERQ
jgi:two-component system phosphate regulon sensor histidine kinase PhoR